MSQLLKTLQFIFGYDFGYYSHKSYKNKIILSIIFLFRCVIIDILMSLILCYKDMREREWFFGIFNLGQRLFLLCAFMFIPSDSSLREIECEIKDIDKLMKSVGASRFVQKRLILSLFLCYVIRFNIHIYLYHYQESFSYWKEIIEITATAMYFINVISKDTIMLYFALMFYSIYHRFVIFETFLRKDSYNDFSIYYRLYKSLADVIEKFKCTYQLVVSLFDD